MQLFCVIQVEMNHYAKTWLPWESHNVGKSERKKKMKMTGSKMDGFYHNNNKCTNERRKD